MRKLYMTIVGGMMAAMVFASSAFATADPALTSATGQITDYFSDNLAVVITVLVSVSLVLWLIGMAIKSVGANKKKPG